MTINELIGKTLTKIEGKKGDGELGFHTTDGEIYRLYHSQRCCESVYLDDVCGEFGDLIGFPILQAEETSNIQDPGKPSQHSVSWTWTFYRITTMKGQVVLRWIGESNGNYSESVSFCKL